MASNKFRTTRAAFLAVIATGSLVVSACGSSTPSAGGGSSSSTSSSAASAPSSAAGPASSGSASASSKPAGSSPSGGAAPATLTPAMIDAAKATLTDKSALKVCTSLPYPPFESADLDGNIVGFDMDLMDQLAKDLGVSKKVVDTDFTGIKSGQAMVSGTCDIASAAMTINAERQKVITFSAPYYDASQALLVKADSTVATLADLKGKRLAAQSGTTGQTYAAKFAAQNGYQVVEFSNITEVEQAVLSGNAAAGIHDDGPLFDLVKTNNKYKVATNFKTGEQYGFGAKKGNTALIAVTDAMLTRIKADGTFKKIQEKWIKIG